MLTRAIVIEPTGIEPTGMEPTGVFLMSIDPTGIDPRRIEPTGIEPTGIEPTGAPCSADDTIDVEPRVVGLVQLIGGPLSPVRQRWSVLSLVGPPSTGGTGIEPTGVEPRPIAAGVSEPSGLRVRSIEPTGTEFRRVRTVAFASTWPSVTFCSGSVAKGVPARTEAQLDGGASGIVASETD